MMKKKFDLTPIDRRAWKWSRMRPSNFPSLRLAQLAAVFSKEMDLMRTVLASKSIQELRSLFTEDPSPYWSTH